MRPPEEDATINILEGAVRSGKTWRLIAKRFIVARTTSVDASCSPAYPSRVSTTMS